MIYHVYVNCETKGLLSFPSKIKKAAAAADEEDEEKEERSAESLERVRKVRCRFYTPCHNNMHLFFS